jgi:glucose-1-phosphate adenylyltransferase
MKTDIVGLIYTGDQNERLRELARIRSVAALPMLGRYRLIDFLLSNMVNSGMHNVGVILQRNYQSLLDQIGSGREWNLHGKRAGLTLLPPFAGSDHGSNYEGLLDALKSNLSFLRRSTERYIAVCDANMLYSIDFIDLLKQHLDKNADLTMVYTKQRDVRRNGSGRYFGLDNDGWITRLEFDPVIPRYENTYIGAFIVRREMLIDMVDRATSQGMHHFTRELLVRILQDKTYKLAGYELPGRVWYIDSVEAYYNANMDALNVRVRQDLFKPNRPVWTKLLDGIPTRYASNAKAINSLIADGCIIEGTVENSIVFRGAKIGPGAVVRGSIVMQDVVIGRDAEIENCIFDKGSLVRDGGRLIAPREYPIVVGKNLTI